MPQNYVPIFIFMAVIGVLLPVTLLAAKLVRPDNPSKTKLMPYECGIDPIDSARGRYTVRYYIVAILFVVFDVETIFLFPWAVKFKALGLFGFLEMLIFLRHPDRRLYLGLGKGRAGMGVTPSTLVGRALGRNLYRQPLDSGQFPVPDSPRGQPAARQPREVAPVWQQRREHCHVESRLGAHFDRRAVGGDSIESTGGTDPITSHGHRKDDAQRIRDLIERYQAQARAHSRWVAPFEGGRF